MVRGNLSTVETVDDEILLQVHSILFDSGRVDVGWRYV